jgi:hypothetical protein
LHEERDGGTLHELSAPADSVGSGSPLPTPLVSSNGSLPKEEIKVRALCATVVTLFTAALFAAGASADNSERPLKGSFTGSGLSFAGTLTHLGKFTSQITSFAFTPTGAVDTFTLTAANGDEVFISEALTITGFDTSTGLFTFTTEGVITGGTGRFTGATGAAADVGEAALDLSYYYGTFNGTIDY